MPAPTRTVTVPKPISQSSVMAEEPIQQPIVVPQVGSLNPGGDFLTRFTEVIMFGGAMIAIWTGLLGIAFADDASNWNYLVLFFGGLISAGIAISMVEFHARKNEYLLMPSQNYLLGISFFFMAVGLLWGIRFMGGWLTFDQSFIEFDLFGTGMSDEGQWVPNANMIYAQSCGAFFLILSQRLIIQRYAGELTFSWTVAAIIPLALLLVGVGPWIGYSNNLISYELGIAIIALSALSMWMAIQSNKSITFIIIAPICGLIPLVYEFFNDNAPEDGIGGSISLMLFIILIQGYLATSPKLNQKLMERASFFLIGEVVLVMFIAGLIEANAIIGPFRLSDTGLADTVTLPVLLWFTTLIAYFPAVHARRVPAMPIGLAFALWTLNGDEAIIPWIVAIGMVTYMLFFAEATRQWVANLTMVALASAYFISDNIEYGIDDAFMNLLIALALIFIAWVAMRMEKITIQFAISSVVLVSVTETILNSEFWFTGWLILIFLLSLVYEKMKQIDIDQFTERRNVSLALATTLSFGAGLMLTDRLSIPYEPAFLSGASIEFIVFGIIVYGLFYNVRHIEFDIGEYLFVLRDKASSQWVFNHELNVWMMRDEDDEGHIQAQKWGEIARFSVAFSLFCVSLGFATIKVTDFTHPYILPVVFLIPIGMLLHQLLSMDVISSQTRFVGSLHLLIIALFGAPMVHDVQSNMSQTIDLQIGLVHDLIFLAAPLYVHFAIIKRGLDTKHLDRISDQSMFLVLLLIGCLDTSGGLLFFTMFGLVTYQVIKYKLWVINLIPVVFLFTLSFGTFDQEGGLTHRILDLVTGDAAGYLEERVLWFSQFTGFIVSVLMLGVLGISFNDSKNEHLEHQLPWAAPLIWFVFGAWSALPDAAWLPLVVVYFGILNAWVRGEMRYMTGLSVGLVIAWLIGFSDSHIGQNDFGLSMFWSGANLVVLSLLASNGTLTKYVHHEGEFDKDYWKSKLSNDLRIIGLGALLLSFTEFNGMGMLVASIWATYEVISKGEKTPLLFLPILHALTLGNQLWQYDIGDTASRDFFVGGLLFAESLALLYMSTKDDLVYDLNIFEWHSDEEFFEFVERLGFSSTISAIIGVAYGFSSDLELTYLLLTVILTGLAITGFNVKYQDSRWRRALGVYGSVISAILFYTEVDNDLFANLTIVGIGLLTLGYGFFYLQQRSNAPVMDYQLDIPQLVSSPGSSHDEEEDDVDVNFEQELDSIPDAVTKDSVKKSKFDAIKSQASTSNDDDKTPSNVPNDVPIPAPVLANNDLLIETKQGFQLRLPPGVAEKIVRTIDVTPHDGFKPVLELYASGKVQLHFEPK